MPVSPVIGCTRALTAARRCSNTSSVLGFVAWLRVQPPALTLVVAHEETLRVFCAHFRRLSDAEMLSLVFANAEILTFVL